MIQALHTGTPPIQQQFWLTVPPGMQRNELRTHVPEGNGDARTAPPTILIRPITLSNSPSGCR